MTCCALRLFRDLADLACCDLGSKARCVRRARRTGVR